MFDTQTYILITILSFMIYGTSFYFLAIKQVKSWWAQVLSFLPTVLYMQIGIVGIIPPPDNVIIGIPLLIVWFGGYFVYGAYLRHKIDKIEEEINNI